MPTVSTTAVPRSFSASWAGVIRGYYMHQTLWTPYVREKPTTVREPGNEHDRSAQVECNRTRWNNVRFILGIAHFTQISATLLARLPHYRKRSILQELVVVCNAHFHLSLWSFLHLTLLQDSFMCHFLMLRHSLCCQNFYSCVTLHK